MQGIPFPVIATFAGSVIGQLVALAILPRTLGFTNPGPTVACSAIYLLSIWMIARLSRSGVDLSILIPLMAAVVPLGAIAIGTLLYGEDASFLKVAVLISACGLIGVASRLT